MGCGFPTTRKDDQFIFTQKFSYNDCYSVYAADDNNVFLIQTTPEIADTPDTEITDEDVVDNMGDDILESTERENGYICDESYYICGEEH